MNIAAVLIALALLAAVVLIAGAWRTAVALHPHHRWVVQAAPMSGWVYLLAFVLYCLPALAGVMPLTAWGPGVFVFALAGFALMLVRSQPMRFGLPTLA